jgi:hypothetical protein
MMEMEKEDGQKLRTLEEHLRQENPLLVDAVKDFLRLDKIGHRMGLLKPSQSYAGQIAWWPLVSVLGTFSSGKSTFINHFLQYPLQTTGTQAVDDKFTVICYGADKDVKVLPGIALNSDPRFPFYKMSRELEKVRPGEGSRIDAYLQLKTCPSDTLRGQILIDSPGFDADAQRSATLKITDYIMDLSDLVLIFFDARHPEPGAMRDTLTHLVANTIGRRDSTKFLYILNQIDTSARENNPEEVVGAWHRAMAQEGLTAAKFYCVYMPEAAIPIEDEALRQRFETKRDLDMAEIYNRIRQVGLERAYRIGGALQNTVREIEDKKVPFLKEAIGRWRRTVLTTDVVILAVLLAACVAVGFWAGFLSWDNPVPGSLKTTMSSQWAWSVTGLVAMILLIVLHFFSKRWAARRVLSHLKMTLPEGAERESMMRACLKNIGPWRSIFNSEPMGWGSRARKQVRKILADADRYVQNLNDSFTDPSGKPIDLPETQEGHFVPVEKLKP